MNTIFMLTLQQTGAQGGGASMQIVFLVLIVVVFWFFMIRPQMKRQKELKKYRDELKKGDKIMTTGGIFGKIVEISDFTVIIEVESQARLKVSKEAVVKDMTDIPAAK
jgi:preprotein translocase, yajC subunit